MNPALNSTDAHNASEEEQVRSSSNPAFRNLPGERVSRLDSRVRQLDAHALFGQAREAI